jgi:hypothetical protein
LDILSLSGSLLEHGAFKCFGHFDGDKTVGAKQVIFAALVNDPQVPIALRIRVGDDRVNLVEFQGGIVPRVVNADNEPRCGFAVSFRPP